MFLTSVGNIYRAVALRQHDERAPVVLELIHIRVHAPCRGRTHRAARHPRGSLRRARVIDRMVLQVLRHSLAGVQTRFYLRVRDVPSHNNRTIQRQARAYRVVRQYLADLRHRLIQVNAHGIALARVAQLFGNQRRGIAVHLLYPNTVFVDFALDVAVCRATHA